jgi:hypothetical protein
MKLILLIAALLAFSAPASANDDTLQREGSFAVLTGQIYAMCCAESGKTHSELKACLVNRWTIAGIFKNEESHVLDHLPILLCFDSRGGAIVLQWGSEDK